MAVTAIPRLRGTALVLLLSLSLTARALLLLTALALHPRSISLRLFFDLLEAANISPAAGELALGFAEGAQLVDTLLASEVKRLKLLRAACNDGLGKRLLLVGHLAQTLLLLDVGLPGLAMLFGVLLLHLVVELLVLCHLDLVGRLDKRDLFLALGALEVVHHLCQAHKLALHVLTLLDLLLDGILHEAALVDLLALLELDLEALLALVALLRFGQEGESLLLLLFLHLLADTSLLTSAALLLETLRLALFVLTLGSKASLLELLLLLLKDTLLLLLAALDDDLASKSKLVLALDLREKLRGVGRGSRGGGLGIHQLDRVTELLCHRNEVVLDVVALELITLEPDTLVLMVEAHRNCATLGSIHENALDLRELHKWDHLLKRFKLHGLVHLGGLLQHANNGEAAHARKEHVELDGGDGTRGRELHRLGVERGEHGLGVLAHVQWVELLLEEGPHLASLSGHQGENALGDELVEERLAGEQLARVPLGVEGVAQQRGHAYIALLGSVKLLI